ncbi:MAG: ribonuclease HI family protein [Bacteroidales bacterium]|nr:ribonuclease HI family protein [Bacteroidales bacterium]
MNVPKNPIKRDDILKIYTDGASRKNPGPSAYAFIFVKEEEKIHSENKFLGIQTNNQAEYTAIIKALKKAVEYTRWKVEVYSDSELVVNQINGVWRIKKDHLKELNKEVHEQKSNFEDVRFIYVPRENPFIKEADKLCNQCLNNNLGDKR